MTMDNKRPELVIGVGDEVIVQIPIHRGTREEQARITKIARVWVDMVRVEDENKAHPYAWKLRRDTQSEGGTGSYRVRFVTEEQHVWEKRQTAAREFLREAGIETWKSRYRNDILTLANLIRVHEGLDPI